MKQRILIAVAAAAVVLAVVLAGLHGYARAQRDFLQTEIDQRFVTNFSRLCDDLNVDAAALESPNRQERYAAREMAVCEELCGMTSYEKENVDLITVFFQLRLLQEEIGLFQDPNVTRELASLLEPLRRDLTDQDAAQTATNWMDDLRSR